MQLLDIEGTVCPISFVHDRLFPWARERLPGFLDARRDDPAVVAALVKVRAMSGATTVREQIAVLRMWMDADAKVQPLKTLQGLIWDEGWASGVFVTPIYPDVVVAFGRWARDGERVAVYSSGSVQAQKQLFAHTTEGDLRPYVAAWFDTQAGSKRDPGSYALIADELGYFPEQITFWSDTLAELDAAESLGMATRLVQRDSAEPRSLSRHPVVTDLSGPVAQPWFLSERRSEPSASNVLAPR
jgi:enolase-phosphatase E1